MVQISGGAMRTFYAAGLMVLLFAVFSSGQQVQQAPRSSQGPAVPSPLILDDFASNRPSNTPTSSAGQDYRIGKDDLIEVSVFEAPELGGASRVTATGQVTLPLVGAVDVAGHTVREVEEAVERTLKEKYVNDPHVTVFLREYASQPVSVIGDVKLPGIYQIKGEKSLLDMLAMAQGLDGEAGNTIQIIRAKLPGSGPDEPLERVSVVNTQDLMENGKTELNVPIHAGDTINVLRAGSVFVVGEVIRPNEFVLRNGKNVTLTQAVALANGFTKDAKKAECTVIRYHKDGSKEEIKADAAKILRGQANDVTMLPNDILFVPAAKLKPAAMRVLDSTIAVATGRLIYTGF
jgi:polysaccharide export outer membrane protein